VTGGRFMQMLPVVVDTQILALGQTYRLAAVGVDTVRRIEASSAFSELSQLAAGLPEGLYVLIEGRHVPFQQIDHVMTGGLTLTAQLEDRRDLGEGEAGGLGIPDEGETVDGILGVVPIVVGIAGRLGEQSDLFVIADRLGSGTCSVRQFSDSHEASVYPLDIPVDWKVYLGTVKKTSGPKEL
jgi:hypothetical protein